VHETTTDFAANTSRSDGELAAHHSLTRGTRLAVFVMNGPQLPMGSSSRGYFLSQVDGPVKRSKMIRSVRYLPWARPFERVDTVSLSVARRLGGRSGEFG
jgi:hypothetical protein